MGRVRTKVVTASMLTYLTVQSWYVLRRRNRWPFCSYDMFSYHLGDQQSQVRVRLVTDRGAVLGPVMPWGLLPVEFFRVEDIVTTTFVENSPDSVRDELCAAIVTRLNGRRWRDWDEIRASYHPPRGHRVVAIDFYQVTVDCRADDDPDPLRVRGAELLHRYDPDRVLVAGDEPSWRMVDR